MSRTLVLTVGFATISGLASVMISASLAAPGYPHTRGAQTVRWCTSLLAAAKGGAVLGISLERGG